MREQEAGTANELSGSVHGPSVQAGVVHGDVHILTGAGSGDVGGGGGGPRVPWQLPPTVPLTDRTESLALLEHHRADLAEHGHPALTTLSGLGGVGKTTLALAWLHTLRERYPGGQLYADLRAQSPDSPADPGEILARFLRDLGVAAQHVPVDIAERAALYRSLTARRRIVVLLDDALTAAQVRPLLPGGSNVTAVTSRRRLSGLTLDGCRTVQLEPLAGDAAPAALARPGSAPPAPYGGETTRLLDLLHDASLLVDAGDERHRFHDLVRLHAAAKAVEDEPPEESAAARRRIADHYLAGATRAEEIIDPQHRTMARTYGPGPLVEPDLSGDGDGDGDGQPDPNTALDWLERELPNAMATLRSARASGFPSVAWQLADAMWPLFLRRKHYDHWRAAHEEGLAAARESADVAAECRMLTSGGVGELDMDHEAALAKFEEAARLFEETGDALGQARTLNYRGLALQRLGRREEAAAHFARAADTLPGCGDGRAGALARFNLAELALTDGRSEEALGNARDAHGVLRDAGDVYNAARAAALVGSAYVALGDGDGDGGEDWGEDGGGEAAREALREAESWLEGALAVLRPMSADYETARALESSARLAELRGQSERASEHCREAAALYSAAGHGADGA